MPIIHISLVSHAWLSRKVHSVDTQGCSVLIRRDAQPETANFVVAALLEESPCSRGGGVRRCSASTTRHRHRCHQLWEVRPSVESGVDRAAGPRQQGRLRHIRLCHSPGRSTLLSPVLPCCGRSPITTAADATAFCCPFWFQTPRLRWTGPQSPPVLPYWIPPPRFTASRMSLCCRPATALLSKLHVWVV